MADQPKYQRIAETLRRAIRSGEYAPGDRLPGENELAAVHAVAKMTARHALAVLKEEGLTETRRGAGVFVLPSTGDLGHAKVGEALGKPPVAIHNKGPGSPRPHTGEAMIFGGEATSAQVGTDPVRVRVLELEEVRNLGPEELIYVQAQDFKSLVLVPAYRKMRDEAYLDRGDNPRVHVRSIFGSEFYASAENGVFEADDLGEEMPVIRSAGTRVSSSVFISGLDPDVAEERVRKALRAEFGPGVVEVWNMRSGPVRDLRWDVYAIRTSWVSESRKGEGSFQEVERRVVARNIRDGHERYYMGKEPVGWQLVTEPHQPDTTQTEVL
jgi:hypothetical protein